MPRAVKEVPFDGREDEAMRVEVVGRMDCRRESAAAPKPPVAPVVRNCIFGRDGEKLASVRSEEDRCALESQDSADMGNWKDSWCISRALLGNLQFVIEQFMLREKENRVV